MLFSATEHWDSLRQSWGINLATNPAWTCYLESSNMPNGSLKCFTEQRERLHQSWNQPGNKLSRDTLAWTKQYALWDSQCSFNKDTVTQSWEDAQRHAPKILQMKWTQSYYCLFTHICTQTIKQSRKPCRRMCFIGQIILKKYPCALTRGIISHTYWICTENDQMIENTHTEG